MNNTEETESTIHCAAVQFMYHRFQLLLQHLGVV